MLHRFLHSLRFSHFCTVALCLCSATPLALAQSSTKPNASKANPSNFDPSDVYFQGFMSVRTAEQLEAAGDYIAALEKLNKAQQLFEAVTRFYPEWKPSMVKVRSEKTAETIASVQVKANDQLAKQRNQVAELEGGVKKSATKATPVIPEKNILEVDPLVARKLENAEKEVKRLQSLSQSPNLNNAQASVDKLKQQINQSQSEREKIESKLQQAQQEVKRLQSLNQQTAKEANQSKNDLRQDLQAAQGYVEDLKKELAAVPVEREKLNQQLNSAQTEVQRLRLLNEQSTAQQGNLASELAAAQNHVESLRRQLAAAPMEKDMLALNQRIGSLEQERLALELALKQSTSAHTEALARIATLQAEKSVMQEKFNELAQKQTDLERNMKSERDVSNSVVAGQRRQIENLEKQLQSKNSELEKSQLQVQSLMRELKESQDSFSQLRAERDSLVQEREQMSALLKLNEAGRIQDLIEQNMGLAKQLREANEKVDRLYRESNTDKDALNTAQRDLAIAKAQINRLHQDRREQEKQLANLQQRLKDEEANLAKNQNSADQGELEVLRDIIKRQLRKQERQRQARELLIQAAKDLGNNDPSLAQAVDLLDGQEYELSPEESKLLAGQKSVDGEFVSPFARDRSTVEKATSSLERDISVFERTAEKSYLAGRLMPTRELYLMILDQHPNHTPSLCKLGVVYLKLNDPVQAVDSFRRAVEMDPNNPYAHRMLGFCLMQLNDLAGAEEVGKKAVELAPNDAKSQLLLGIICHRRKRISEAESYFKAAISADSMLHDAYYNLALLYARSNKKDKAHEYYQQALERGAVPDPQLEQSIDHS